jgi:ribonuclease HI
MTFYAVAVGVKQGIYTTWNECKMNINDYAGAIFKKFETIEEAIEFIDDYNLKLYVYTDGACIHNGTDNARASIGIYFSRDNPNNISRELEKKDGIKLTNNIAELTAVIEAIMIIKDHTKPNKIIVTDSEYVIKCATSYGKKLSENNWKTKEDKRPPNVNLVKRLYELVNKYDIQFKHVIAHTNKTDKHSIGNYYADQLANKAIGIDESNKKLNTKIYLKVQYKDKDDAKDKGARWDSINKKWYIYEDNRNLDYFKRTYL